MRELNYNDINFVPGAGDVDWVQVGRDFSVGGATVAGTVFGTGLAGPLGPAIGVLCGVGVGALYDWGSNSGVHLVHPVLLQRQVVVANI